MLVVVAAAAALAATLFLPVLRVSGDSMTPSLQDQDVILLWKTGDLKAGDLVGFSWQNKLRKAFHKAPKQQPKIIHFHVTERPKKAGAPAYTHKCTVCGRTDVSNPELEFRYCSKCKGYYCYCQDHISNHTHIQ